MIVLIDHFEKKQLVQDTVERLQYCKGFKEDLQTLLAKYEPHKEVKYSNNPIDFKFPLEEAF